MFSQMIVFVILSILSCTAVFAASAPISKASQERVQPEEADRDSSNSL